MGNLEGCPYFVWQRAFCVNWLVSLNNGIRERFCVLCLCSIKRADHGYVNFTHQTRINILRKLEMNFQKLTDI
jgi:hypothetical protein